MSEKEFGTRQTMPKTGVSEILARDLICPRCRGHTDVRETEYSCSSCGFRGPIERGIVFAGQGEEESFFDTRFETMQIGNQDAGIASLCYERQTRMLLDAVKPGSVILDVGCGPQLAYRRSSDWTIFGIDPSLHSLRANNDLDIGIFGSAESIPLRDRSADIIVCFYSVHHMVGSRVGDNREKVVKAFSEFGRVLKKGGTAFVFDMSPWRPVWVTELSCWTTAKRLLGPKLDMFFWHQAALRRIAVEAIPTAKFEICTFPTPLTTTFPPIFALQNLRIPRFLYPFDALGYKMTL